MLDWIKSLFTDESEGSSASASGSRSARELAERGENVAARHLRNKGYKIILRNFRSELGELDIIARDGKTLVFVEVKARTSDDVAAPEAAVDAEKQKQVVRVAKQYMTRYGIPQPAHRFDIVAIVWPPGRKPQIEHFENAFS
jgi:putative endonuclease